MESNFEYYSFSRISLFLKSKREFYKRYILKEEQIPNKFFEKGKEFAEFKETGHRPHFCDDPLLEIVAEAVPSLDVSEKELRCEIEGFKLLSYLDSFKNDGTIFYEYKTGKNPWTQEMVDDELQLKFYALVIYAVYKVIPVCKLFWIETEELEINGENKLRYTGVVQTFEKIFTEEELVATFKKVISVILEIEEFQYLEADLDDNLVQRYAELDEKSKEIKKEMDLIKLEVQTFLAAEGVQYGSSNHGRFSVSKRTNWLYSENVKETESKYKAEIDKLKKEDIKSGKAKASYTEFLLFKKT